MGDSQLLLWTFKAAHSIKFITEKDNLQKRSIKVQKEYRVIKRKRERVGREKEGRKSGKGEREEESTRGQLRVKSRKAGIQRIMKYQKERSTRNCEREGKGESEK